MMETTAELNKAMAAARAEIKNPHMDSTNPHFKSKFASLKSCIDATIPVAAAHGVAVHQDLQTVEGGLACYTHLCHDSGEEKVYGPLVIPFTKHDAQGYASASTYARRYHLMGVFCIVGDADDDGNAASESAFTSTQARSKARNELIKASGLGDDERVLEITSGFDNDQKAEMWGLLSKPQKDLIKESLERLKEPKEAE